MNKSKREDIAILLIFILVVIAFFLYAHPYNQSKVAVCSPFIKLTVVSGIWCQYGNTFESSFYNNTWDELILTNKNYSAFNLSLTTSIKNGNSLLVAWDFEPANGTFYDIRVSKLYNQILFEKFIKWNRTYYKDIANFTNPTKILIIKKLNSTEIFLNGNFVYKILDNGSGSLALFSEFASGNFSNIELNNITIKPINIDTYLNIIFTGITAVVFVILLIFREEEEKNRRGLFWDILLVLIIILPLLAFMYNGTVNGYFFILYVPFLYCIYIVLESIQKGKRIKFKELFSFKEEYNKLVYILIIVLFQVIIAFLDWFVNGTLVSLNFPIASSIYSNLLFYKLEPFFWLVVAVFFFLGNKKAFGTAIKIFLLGVFVIFSGIEDVIYNLVSLHPIPATLPWLYVPGTVLGQPVSIYSLVWWLVIMFTLIIFVTLLPLHNLFIIREKKHI